MKSKLVSGMPVIFFNLQLAACLLCGNMVNAQSVFNKHGDFASANDILSMATINGSGHLVMIGKSDGPTGSSLPSMVSLMAEVDKFGVTYINKYFAFYDPATQNYYETVTNGICYDNGVYFLTGKIKDPLNGNEDVFVSKFNTSGIAISTKRFDLDHTTLEEGVRVLVNDNTVYVTGVTNNRAVNYNYQTTTLPLHSTFILGLDLNLNLLSATRIEFPYLQISLEVKDFDGNPNGPTGFELALVGYLRGADANLIDLNLPYGGTHTSSFMMRYSPASSSLISFLVYYSFLGGAPNNTESLYFEDINREVHNNGGGTNRTIYNIAGQIETQISSTSGGNFFYAGLYDENGIMFWERPFAWRSLASMMQNNYVGTDSHGYELRGRDDANVQGRVHYYGIGTSWNNSGNKDMFFIHFAYNHANGTDIPLNAYYSTGKSDEEGRSLLMDLSNPPYHDYLAAGYGNSFNTPSTFNDNFLSYLTPAFMQGCYLTSESLYDLPNGTNNVGVNICDMQSAAYLCNFLPVIEEQFIHFTDLGSDRDYCSLQVTPENGDPALPGDPVVSGRPTGIVKSVETADGISLFPNPAGNFIHVRNVSDGSGYLVKDFLGRDLIHGSFTGTETTINTDRKSVV